MERLKPCPFCGGQAKIQKIMETDPPVHFYDWVVSCTSCYATMQMAADNYYGREYYTEEEVVEQWNRRVD